MNGCDKDDATSWWVWYDDSGSLWFQLLGVVMAVNWSRFACFHLLFDSKKRNLFFYFLPNKIVIKFCKLFQSKLGWRSSNEIYTKKDEWQKMKSKRRTVKEEQGKMNSKRWTAKDEQGKMNSKIKKSKSMHMWSKVRP